MTGGSFYYNYTSIPALLLVLLAISVLHGLYVGWTHHTSTDLRSIQEQGLLTRMADFLEEDPAHKHSKMKQTQGQKDEIIVAMTNANDDVSNAMAEVLQEQQQQQQPKEEIQSAKADYKIQQAQDVSPKDPQEQEEHNSAAPYFYNSNATASSSYDNDPRPRNLRLAFFGDSVTRYQYIDLAYFLKTGKWISVDDKPNILYHHEFKDWNDFFVGSNALLRPQEHCDCWLRTTAKFSMGLLCENRYFYESTRNNMLVYIQKFGFRTTHGYWSPDEVWDLHIENHTQGAYYKWVHNTWNETIAWHLGKLRPKLDFLVFNAGLHPHHLNEKAVYEPLLNTAVAHGMIPIYKTTTYPDPTMRQHRFSRGAHDKFLCQVTHHCLDQSWTGDITGPEHYYDANHFKPHINRRMNEQLLNYLNTLVQ